MSFEVNNCPIEAHRSIVVYIVAKNFTRVKTPIQLMEARPEIPEQQPLKYCNFRLSMMILLIVIIDLCR